VIESGGIRAAFREMQLKAPDILESRRIWGTSQECGEVLDRSDVALPRERFSRVLGMFSSLEVKVLYPT
jgi:hypothetical protein